jgi:uncharacterized protein (DUF58 family)
MLTARGYWFLVLIAFLLALGVLLLPDYTIVPAVLGLSLLCWFLFEWVTFEVRRNLAVSQLRATRRVVQSGRDMPMVWAGLDFEVHVEIGLAGPAGLPFILLDDRIPQAAEKVTGESSAAFDILPNRPARLVYTLRSQSPGILRFEGARVRIADLHGFFCIRLFLRDETEYLILPPLSDDEGRQRADKRFNTLPPPGIHRLRRPGSGDELLDLRDYRPGDPPKMIAWKASARRDRLITKEYESDVPVRCVLLLDSSEGMRLGPPGNTSLTRMAAVASGVAQATAGNRDLVGLTTFDEVTSKAMPPARTKLHMINILRRLAEVAALQPGIEGVPAEQLTARAYPLAQELYPELMTSRINSMPLGRLWIPLLDRRWGWLALVVMGLSPALILIPGWFHFVLNTAAEALPRDLHWIGKILLFTTVVGLLISLPSTLTMIFWFFHGIRGWFGPRRRQLTRRKQLAALFALQDGVGAAGIERLIHDDELYAARISRFLRERQIRMPVPLYDDQGRYRYRSEDKAHVLASALLRAVGRARDNELYVILADLAELDTALHPILKAVRVARARHHQVLVIVPWPADMPPPEDPAKVGTRPAPKASQPGRASAARSGRILDRNHLFHPVVRSALAKQYHKDYRKLRRVLSQIGASVVRVNDGDSVRVVLDRLDRLRGMRSRR